MYRELSAEDKRAFIKDFFIELMCILGKILVVIIWLAVIAFAVMICMQNPFNIIYIMGTVAVILIFKWAKDNAVQRFENRKHAKTSMEEAMDSIKVYEESKAIWEHKIPEDEQLMRQIENEKEHCDTCIEYWQDKYNRALYSYIANGGKS
jgi:hypothetical protein